jgi:NAD+ kinase
MSERPHFTRAALIARQSLPAALEALTAAAIWLEQRGCAPLVEAASAEAAGLGTRWPTVAREALASNADVVIAFGGDGTLLNAAGAIAQSPDDTPILGVNLGRLGFLVEVGRADLETALEALLSGRFTTETRLMLACRVRRSGGTAIDRLALNDVVVTRGALSRMIELDVAVDGQPVSHVKADGLIVATATGSTAYNLSAGGPIVHPGVDALVLTPIAPHTLSNRPLVLPATAAITLRPRFEPQSEVVLTFDGQYGVSLAADDVVDVTRAARVLRLVHVSPRTHFDMLREKLKWGD